MNKKTLATTLGLAFLGMSVGATAASAQPPTDGSLTMKAGCGGKGGCGGKKEDDKKKKDDKKGDD